MKKIGKYAVTALIQIVVCEILPAAFGALACFLFHRKHFKFQKGDIFSKNKVLRFLSRLIVILLFFAVKCVLEKTDRGNWLAGKMPEMPEVFETIIPYALCSVLFAIMISVFSLAYGVTELIFVPEQKD